MTNNQIDDCKLHISIADNKVYSDKIKQIECFTEYGLKYSQILVYPIGNQFDSNNSTLLESILLVPITHMINIWHLMHHLFTTYKYQTTYDIKTKNVFFVFFPLFYEKCCLSLLEIKYLELFFNGLGFDYNQFLNTYNIFNSQKSIHCKKIFIVNQSINFNGNEPLFRPFINKMLSNYKISYNTTLLPNVVFVLRKGSRSITNMDDVKKQLSNYQIQYIYMEDYSVFDQINIISKCNVYIGVHGQGLTWLVFMKPRSIVIELYPGNSNTDNYIRFSKLAQIRYHRLSTDIVSGTEIEFRDATVKLSISKINEIKNIIKNI